MIHRVQGSVSPRGGGAEAVAERPSVLSSDSGPFGKASVATNRDSRYMLMIS